MPGREVVDNNLKNIGQQRGLEVWRIENFSLAKLHPEEHGSFYSGDSYVVLYTKNPGEWNVHFWLGNDTSIDERGTAAIKTVELDDSLNGLPVQYREVQFYESSLFLSYFKDGIRYLKGGAPTGFSHVDDLYANWTPRLLRCKGKRNVRCTQVDCKLDSLNLGDVYILDCGLQIYVWMPPESGRLERIKGMSQAKNIRDVERVGRPNVHVLDSDWDTNEEFWAHFGGVRNVSKLRPAEADGVDENFWRSNRQDVTLWKVSDQTGKMEIKLISQGNFKNEQLDSADAFILDAANGGIYVWVGKGCTVNERKKAMEWATKFLEEKHKSKNTQVVRVLEGAEPTSFTQWASDWIDPKKTRQFQPKLYQCSNESGRLVVEEIANYTQEDLDGDDVMILDALNIIYVWIGAGANKEEKKHAEGMAKKYLETDAMPRSSKAAVEVIHQGSETPLFKKIFPEWNDQLWSSEARSYENMRRVLFS